MRWKNLYRKWILHLQEVVTVTHTCFAGYHWVMAPGMVLTIWIDEGYYICSAISTPLFQVSGKFL